MAAPLRGYDMGAPHRMPRAVYGVSSLRRRTRRAERQWPTNIETPATTNPNSKRSKTNGPSVRSHFHQASSVIFVVLEATQRQPKIAASEHRPEGNLVDARETSD
jgi:hypothetical protein